MKQLLFLIALMLVFGLSCGDDSKGKKQDYYEKIQAKFLTKENPGKWKNHADNHVPNVSAMKKDKKLYIYVQVPLIGSVVPVHYVETILLLDHNHNELQKVTFDKWTKIASATFTLPEDYKSFIYVVAKCNLHDMWKKKVILE